MSNIVLFSIVDNISYKKMHKLSNSLVKLSLLKKKGIIFNFLGYDEELIRRFNLSFYFSVSDDFLQLNSNFCNVCDILHLKSKNGKNKFKKKFAIFDDIYLHLLNNKINEFILIISDQDAEVCDFTELTFNQDLPSDILYDYILTKENDSYSFGAVIIRFKKIEKIREMH